MFHKNNTKGLREQSITFGSNGIRLKGKVILPVSASAEAPVPGVVISHGFGSGYRSMMTCARLLAERGIASIIFDFRGHCKSEGVVDGNMPDDVVDAWNILKDYPEIDKTRMGLVGHSMGAMSSIMAAERLDSPNVLVALSCPPQVDKELFFDLPEDFGHWGSKYSHVMEYPREGSFPWVTGFAGLMCRAWMYFFGYTVKVNAYKFFEGTKRMKMTDVLAKLEGCSKLFIFCDGDSVTPYGRFAPVYASACEPKSMIISKGGFHTTPIMRGNLRNQWIDWLSEKLLG